MIGRFVRRAKAWATLWPTVARKDSYFTRSGWLASRVDQRAVDAAGNPIPWMTYASLGFIEPRLRPDMAVFEFGCGSSTLWWAQRVRQVVSCEHDRQWFELTLALVPENVSLVLATRDEQRYSREILAHKSRFDIIVIDGRDRVRCARNSLDALRPGGVILWDNSDRDHYKPGYEFLHAHGFRRIDFVGMGPINNYGWSTSVFYREQNCLGI